MFVAQNHISDLDPMKFKGKDHKPLLVVDGGPGKKAKECVILTMIRSYLTQLSK